MKKLIVILCALFLIAGCTVKHVPPGHQKHKKDTPGKGPPEYERSKEKKKDTGGSGPSEYDRPKKF
jgi:hypothetical protein